MRFFPVGSLWPRNSGHFAHRAAITVRVRLTLRTRILIHNHAVGDEPGIPRFDQNFKVVRVARLHRLAGCVIHLTFTLLLDPDSGAGGRKQMDVP